MIELLVDATFKRSVRLWAAIDVVFAEAGAASSSAVVYGSVASVISVNVTSRAVKPLIKRSWADSKYVNLFDRPPNKLLFFSMACLFSCNVASDHDMTSASICWRPTEMRFWRTWV